ncbi:MAG TPA: phosphatase PAP2 family protein [Bacteroidota bacterium]
MKSAHIRTFLVAATLILCLESAHSQPRDTISAQQGMLTKMYYGAVKSLAWYDFPIVAADLAQIAFVPGNLANKLIRYPPSNFDKNLQVHVGVPGSRSIIGQISEAGAAAILGTRLLANVGFDLVGGNVTSRDYHRTFWFYKSIVYTYSLTLLTKNIVFRVRPDGSDSQSFFSAHSSTAFCAASYLSLELNDWYGRWGATRSNDALRSSLKLGSKIVLYAGATYVAYARMHDEKHYFSDVAVGAVVGTVVGRLMYQWQWSNDSLFDQNLSFFVVDKTPTIFYTLHF